MRITLWGMYQYDNQLFEGIALPPDIDKEQLVDYILQKSGSLYPYYQVPLRLKNNIHNWFLIHFDNFYKINEALKSQYNPIENYDRYEDLKENRKLSGQDRVTMNKGVNNDITTTLSGQDTLTMNKGTVQTTHSEGTDGNTTTNNGSSNNTASGTDTTKKDVAGFNSSDYSNSDKETIDYGKKDNNEHNDTTTSSGNNSSDESVTNTGSDTDTQSYGKVETVTNKLSGANTDTTEYGKGEDVTNTNHIHGNIGVTTNQQMLESEINLRIKYNLYDIISDLFEKEFIVQIY